ncbi:hypothetical protein [Neptuniibacter caesariensis]|uniref:O-antigen ligase domain-containing protein n=1 Tax=Neptuniibacter caesariensis TaxID=207954 RepID=A0A7U8C4F4_NEPCE|nr:hypothetical protein [Neptuniibacter caesariensis]EAR59930.1 hypothetical protein MED92_16005 [Oceanospirillum sp. MED92] [Neptuniibacter caesariensis]
MNIRVMPENFGQGEWVGNTTLHPIGVLVLGISILAILAFNRDKVLQPFFLLLCFISPAQRIVVAGADFNFFRLAILTLFIRVLMKGENKFFVVQPFDVLFFIYTVVYSLIYAYSSGSLGDPIAKGVELILLYFCVRSVARTTPDVIKVFRFLSLLSIPVCCFFIVEAITGRNFFSVLGGVPEFTKIREGRLRCQGPFPHPIIAGCFWAILFPVFLSMYIQFKQKKYLLACVCAFFIVVTTASSTTLLALLSAPFFMSLYLVRKHIKLLFYSGLACLVCLHMVMSAPVWHLLSRIGAVGGSTSHFRYMLIDKFISHSHEWFLLGTNSTAHWFFGAQDLTNQFVLVGVRSGFLGLFLFVCLLWLFYKKIYFIVRVSQYKVFSWGVFSAMSVSCVSFLGVSYFGQAVYLFNFLFSIVVCMLLHSVYVRKKENDKALLNKGALL